MDLGGWTGGMDRGDGPRGMDRGDGPRGMDLGGWTGGMDRGDGPRGMDLGGWTGGMDLGWMFRNHKKKSNSCYRVTFVVRKTMMKSPLLLRLRFSRSGTAIKSSHPDLRPTDALPTVLRTRYHQGSDSALDDAFLKDDFSNLFCVSQLPEMAVPEKGEKEKEKEPPQPPNNSLRRRQQRSGYHRRRPRTSVAALFLRLARTQQRCALPRTERQIAFAMLEVMCFQETGYAALHALEEIRCADAPPATSTTTVSNSCSARATAP